MPFRGAGAPQFALDHSVPGYFTPGLGEKLGAAWSTGRDGEVKEGCWALKHKTSEARVLQAGEIGCACDTVSGVMG